VADRGDAAGTARALIEDLPIEPICVRVATAVKLTGIPRSTLYELIGAGELQTAKIGRSTFILYSSLKRLFEKH
jgi:excisionase family DNA binding protein